MKHRNCAPLKRQPKCFGIGFFGDLYSIRFDENVLNVIKMWFELCCSSTACRLDSGTTTHLWRNAIFNAPTTHRENKQFDSYGSYVCACDVWIERGQLVGLFVLLGECRQQILTPVEFVAIDDDFPQRMRPAYLWVGRAIRVRVGFRPLVGIRHVRPLTFCFSSSVRASMRTLAHGSSFGHHAGRVDSRPQPGFPRPVEYFSISGMNARSCACVIFSTGVGMPSMISGGSSNSDGSSCTGGGACCARADSSSSITRPFRFRSTSSSGLAPNTL